MQSHEGEQWKRVGLQMSLGEGNSVMSSDAELPPAMGPLRNLPDGADLVAHSPARTIPRRYSPGSDQGVATYVSSAPGNGYVTTDVRPIPPGSSSSPSSCPPPLTPPLGCRDAHPVHLRAVGAAGGDGVGERGPRLIPSPPSSPRL